MIPRIVIPSPTSNDPAYNRLNFSSYMDAIHACGGEAVEIPLDVRPEDMRLEDVAAVAATCQGILLPGSPADVDPAKYGQDADEASAPPDVLREAVDRILLESAHRDGKPLLGICFGVQMLNVFRGGTLIQDVMVMPVNHAAGRAVGIAHAATVAPGTLLADLVDPVEAPELDGRISLPVNSSHHQAVGIPGRGLRVSARCPQDGVIEALESDVKEYEDAPAPFLLGVQWHPERTFATSATSKALFTRFLAEAAAYRPIEALTAAQAK